MNSLQQQTATADVLKVISSSPGELEPVFNAMLEKATHICEAKFGVLFQSEGDGLRAVAMHDAPQPYVEERRRNPIIRPAPTTALGRALATKQPVHMADVLNEPQYFNVPPGYTSAQLTKLAGARTVLAVPMLKENNLVGAIVIYRQEVRPFTDKQTELIKNFASQAVIAIENARLLKELRQRTDDLSESLEQQTATSEVLKVISSSGGELLPVFEALLENATRLCAAKFGTLYLSEGDAFRTTVMHNVPPAFAEARLRNPLFRPPPGSALRRMAELKRAVHIPDVTLDQGYLERQPLFVTAVELGGFLAMLSVPMLKDGNLVGAINIYRQEVGPFSDKQIDLVQNFGAQAVIAIENTRLLSELRESLQQQTATADVLKVISRSTFDLQTVLNTLVEFGCSAVRGGSGEYLAAQGRRLSPGCQLRGHEPIQGVSGEQAISRNYRHRARSGDGRRPNSARGKDRSRARRSGRSGLQTKRSHRRLSHHARCPLVAPGRSNRRDRAEPVNRPPIHRQADRTGRNLRRPGGYRDRERALVRRGAGAH